MMDVEWGGRVLLLVLYYYDISNGLVIFIFIKQLSHFKLLFK